MTNKRSYTGLIILAILAIGGSIAWYATKPKANLTKNDFVKAILASALAIVTPIASTTDYNERYENMIGFDEGYLKAWYDAVKSYNSTFDYNGKKYKTKGGMLV